MKIRRSDIIIGTSILMILLIFCWSQVPSKNQRNNFKLQSIAIDVAKFIDQKRSVPKDLSMVSRKEKVWGPVLKDVWGGRMSLSVDTVKHMVLIFSNGKDLIPHTYDDDSLCFPYLDNNGHYLRYEEILDSFRMSPLKK